MVRTYNSDYNYIYTMKKFSYILVAFFSLLMASCTSSKCTATLAKGNDISKYKINTWCLVVKTMGMQNWQIS